jgi:hypothetical protein
VLRLACAALLTWIGYIHLHLWAEGYQQIPTDGPLFLIDAVAGFALALALLAWPRPLAGLLAVGYVVSDLGALLISLTVGLFGFKGSISAAFRLTRGWTVAAEPSRSRPSTRPCRRRAARRPAAAGRGAR